MDTVIANKEGVWFVTGASKGIGLGIVKTLLLNGYKVAATSRTKESLTKVVLDGVDSKLVESSFIAIECHLADEKSVQNAIKTAVDKFGTINVVINNAGYGVFGPVEDVSDKENRDLFDINFFGTLNVMRNVSSLFRTKKSGYLFNVSSIAALFPMYGLNIYSASKAAIDAVTDAYSQEMKQFNIKVSSLNLGGFISEFEQSMPLVSKVTDEYSVKLADLKAKFVFLNLASKLTNILIQLYEQPADKPVPLHLFGGEDSIEFAKLKVKQYEQEIVTSEELGLNNIR